MYLWKCSRRPGSAGQKYLQRLFYLSCMLVTCLLPLVLTGCQNQNAGASTGLTVLMTGSAMGMHGDFAPRDLQIIAGQTVTWINKSTIQHTVTADDNSFNSGFVKPGASYSHQFLRPGRYPYHCVLHGSELGVGMSGVVIVVTAPPKGQASP